MRLFSERAYDEVSMDDLAREAGIAKGLAYYYFGSKRGFYVAAVEAAARELRAQWDVDDPSLAPAERLRAGVLAYLAHAAERAQGYRTLMAGGVGSDPEVRAILDEERRLVIARVVDGLGLADTPPALRTALQGWLSAMEGATLDWLATHDLGADEVAALLLGLLGGALSAANAVDSSVPADLPRMEHSTEI